MIPLARTRIETRVPAAMRGNGRRARELELLTLWRNRLRDADTTSPKWKDAYWKSGKDVIRKESVGKCAYCETPFAVAGHGDVEHFRPKSTYWWLAYCLDNHLFSCQICNQTFKSDEFPIKGTLMKGPVVKSATTDTALAKLVNKLAPDPVDAADGKPLEKFLQACKAEKAGLIDPYNEDPAEHFAWAVDEVNREVILIPAKQTARTKFIVESAEKYLGLNRELLRRERYQLYELALAYKAILDTPGLPVVPRNLALNGLKVMTGSNRAYAGMIRFFVKLWEVPI